MTRNCDRRTFLHRAAAAGLVAPSLPVLACGPDGGTRSEGEEMADGGAITRPVLLPWSENAVRIAAPLSELPMAYVSRGRQRVFVDHDSRGRASVMLAAHISVSSGLWRIPLLGDDLRIPIPADDALREFEEVDIREWDPTGDPVEGDFRIRRGRRTRVHVEFDCAPVSGADVWMRAGPLEIVQCQSPGEDLCLGALMSVGTGGRYSRRYCAELEGTVRLVTWACPDP